MTTSSAQDGIVLNHIYLSKGLSCQNSVKYYILTCNLVDRIAKHPGLNFVVIINPNSGPGVDPAGWLPDQRYMREIRRLTAKANVQTVGYVRLDYCRRNLVEVEQDIRKYANWAEAAYQPVQEPLSSSESEDEEPTEVTQAGNAKYRNSITGGHTGLGVSGIFFDETPNLYEESVAEYLDSLGQLVKDVAGILDPRMVGAIVSLSCYQKHLSLD